MTNADVKQVLKTATGAHGMYKTRLLEAIESGHLAEFEGARAGRDDGCAFGIWLHRQILPALKHTSQYSKVLSLHAEFHRAVAKALALAEHGKKAEAMECVKQAATPLTLELMAWAREVDS